jgi:hypothetical protein
MRIGIMIQQLKLMRIHADRSETLIPFLLGFLFTSQFLSFCFSLLLSLFCQCQLSSSLCVSLSRHPFVYLTSPTLSPLSMSVSSPFCLSHLPSALCLISLSTGFCPSIPNSALCISVLLGPFLNLPFPKPSIYLTSY